MYVIVLVLAFAGLRLLTLAVRTARARGKQPTPTVDPCLGPVTGLPPRRLPTAEDVLQARLLGGAMSREDYRAAVTRLAARDDRSHPVPPL